MQAFSIHSAVQVFEPRPDVLYTLDTAAHLVGVPRRSILIYCRWGMVHPVVDPDYAGWYFDAYVGLCRT